MLDLLAVGETCGQQLHYATNSDRQWPATYFLDQQGGGNPAVGFYYHGSFPKLEQITSGNIRNPTVQQL